jgi:hypothetical protein
VRLLLAPDLHLDSAYGHCNPGAIRGIRNCRTGTRSVVLAGVTKKGTTLETYLGTEQGFVHGHG